MGRNYMERKGVAEVKLFRTKEQADVKVTLDDALKDQLDGVMVIGLKGGQHITYWSSGFPVLAAVGALEVLKTDLLRNKGEPIQTGRTE